MLKNHLQFEINKELLIEREIVIVIASTRLKSKHDFSISGSSLIEKGCMGLDYNTFFFCFLNCLRQNKTKKYSNKKSF